MGKARIAAAVAVVFVIWLYGAIHVVYGKGLGVTTCWKVGWSFSDTFVDVERISDAELLLTGKVMAAMDKCRIVPDPDAWDRDQVILGLLAFAAATALIWFFGARAQRRNS
jgi:hypothetical protein